MSEHSPGELAAALFGILERVEHGENDDYSNSESACQARSFLERSPNPTPLELEIMRKVLNYMLNGRGTLELRADGKTTHRSMFGFRVGADARMDVLDLGAPRASRKRP